MLFIDLLRFVKLDNDRGDRPFVLLDKVDPESMSVVDDLLSTLGTRFVLGTRQYCWRVYSL